MDTISFTRFQKSRLFKKRFQISYWTTKNGGMKRLEHSLSLFLWTTEAMLTNGALLCWRKASWCNRSIRERSEVSGPTTKPLHQLLHTAGRVSIHTQSLMGYNYRPRLVFRHTYLVRDSTRSYLSWLCKVARGTK